MPDALTVVRIAGDGVGPELVAAGSTVIEALGVPVRWVDAVAGFNAIEEHGTTAPESTIAALRAHRLALKGPFHTPSGGTIRSANHYLRRALDLYAALRPLPVLPGRPPVLLVRENLEDLYAAVEWMPAPDVAQAVKTATRGGCVRITRYAFELARKEKRRRVTLVHKANNLKLTEGMFLSVAREVAREYPDIEFTDMLSDTAASTLVLDPGAFDVIVTSHTIGDILSNLGAALAGSLGLVGSLDSSGDVHVAEASHGSADELAGKDQVNPVAFLRGVVLLLGAIGLADERKRLEQALDQWSQSGARTVDLGGAATTSEVVDTICGLL
ncbi:isocitrate/isopropylmalate family dehydrogenase [Streptomyces puniciscabiei]